MGNAVSRHTTLPAGRLTFQILGAVAEFERELLQERVKARMAHARRTGKHVGRPALRRFQPLLPIFASCKKIRAERQVKKAFISQLGCDPIDCGRFREYLAESFGVK